jgi:lactate dehydrogenase-like 2-hydroxyacid dehydrogenase
LKEPSSIEIEKTENKMSKPIILHIGDPIKYNTETLNRLSSQFTIIRPSLEERQRDAFMQALREKKWGDFQAICRPFWNSGGEMGRWDKELVPLLPKSVKVFASAGAGYDWADVDVLADHGIPSVLHHQVIRKDRKN